MSFSLGGSEGRKKRIEMLQEGVIPWDGTDSSERLFDVWFGT